MNITFDPNNADDLAIVRHILNRQAEPAGCVQQTIVVEDAPTPAPAPAPAKRTRKAKAAAPAAPVVEEPADEAPVKEAEIVGGFIDGGSIASDDAPCEPTGDMTQDDLVKEMDALMKRVERAKAIPAIKDAFASVGAKCRSEVADDRIAEVVAALKAVK